MLSVTPQGASPDLKRDFVFAWKSLMQKMHLVLRCDSRDSKPDKLLAKV
jgi:hypothetical protein